MPYRIRSEFTGAQAEVCGTRPLVWALSGRHAQLSKLRSSCRPKSMVPAETHAAGDEGVGAFKTVLSTCCSRGPSTTPTKISPTSVGRPSLDAALPAHQILAKERMRSTTKLKSWCSSATPAPWASPWAAALRQLTLTSDALSPGIGISARWNSEK